MKNKKILSVSITILLILITTILIYKNNNKITTIEGKILTTGSNYIIIETNEDEDYVINTNKTNYNNGDIIKTDLKNINKDNIPHTATTKKITIIKKSEEINSSNNNNNANETTNNAATNKDINNANETTNNKQSNEANIIKYFENLDNELSTYNKNDESLGEKLKTNFVKCIDFIFYDKEINGKTFSELTNTTKLKILEITLSIDSKINSYFPGYKENINNTYENIKLKTIEKYLEITTNICNNDEELCKTAKENFQSLKIDFSITWDLIKDLASTGIQKLKNWYEIWRYN